MTKTSSEKEVAELQKSIAKLTNRSVISTNLEYLRQRLVDLKTRRSDGTLPNRPTLDPSAVVSASLTKSRVELLERICKDRKLGTSMIMRAAFDAWCAANGYRIEIDHIRKIVDVVREVRS